MISCNSLIEIVMFFSNFFPCYFLCLENFSCFPANFYSSKESEIICCLLCVTTVSPMSLVLAISFQNALQLGGIHMLHISRDVITSTHLFHLIDCIPWREVGIILGKVQLRKYKLQTH